MYTYEASITYRTAALSSLFYNSKADLTFKIIAEHFLTDARISN